MDFCSSNFCYDLRNSVKFEVPRFNLEVGRNSLRYRGALFWNSIPDNLKRAPSLNVSKKMKQQDEIVFKLFLTFSLLSLIVVQTKAQKSSKDDFIREI